MNTVVAQSPKYNSPYPAEVTYTSDKNFNVRLKAMIEREAKDLGIRIDEKFEALIDRIGNIAEDVLFPSQSGKS